MQPNTVSSTRYITPRSRMSSSPHLPNTDYLVPAMWPPELPMMRQNTPARYRQTRIILRIRFRTNSGLMIKKIVTK